MSPYSPRSSEEESDPLVAFLTQKEESPPKGAEIAARYQRYSIDGWLFCNLPLFMYKYPTHHRSNPRLPAKPYPTKMVNHARWLEKGVSDQTGLQLSWSSVMLGMFITLSSNYRKPKTRQQTKPGLRISIPTFLDDEIFWKWRSKRLSSRWWYLKKQQEEAMELHHKFRATEISNYAQSTALAAVMEKLEREVSFPAQFTFVPRILACICTSTLKGVVLLFLHP